MGTEWAPLRPTSTWNPVVFAAMLLATSGCAATPAPETSGAAAHHHHELHLPPVGPEIIVTFDGRQVSVPMANLTHDASSAPLATLWTAAFPGEDVTLLHFDLVGSDGFRPASRPPCTRLLTGSEIAAARIDVVTHDVSFDDGVKLPGCYRVKAVVKMEATR